MARPKLVKTGLGVMLLSVMVGVAPTILLMVTSFTEGPHTFEPGPLSHSISAVMMWTAIMIPFAILGLCLLLAGILMSPKPEPHAERQADEGDTASRP